MKAILSNTVLEIISDPKKRNCLYKKVGETGDFIYTAPRTVAIKSKYQLARKNAIAINWNIGKYKKK